jgi:hypothetical protein
MELLVQVCSGSVGAGPLPWGALPCAANLLLLESGVGARLLASKRKTCCPGNT